MSRGGRNESRREIRKNEAISPSRDPIQDPVVREDKTRQSSKKSENIVCSLHLVTEVPPYCEVTVMIVMSSTHIIVGRQDLRPYHKDAHIALLATKNLL